ncbi:MAG: electron transfer flavoprotein subunit alpha/FixB family protein [Oceanococcaceae bacterium]
MSKILIVAETLNGELHPTTAKAVACAKDIGGDIHVAVFGTGDDSAAKAAAEIDGVTTVLAVNHAANTAALAATLAPQVVALAEGYSHVLAANTTTGKDLMPRVAALLGVPQVTDIMAVHGPREFDRPIYAGNAITTVSAPGDFTLVGTVRTASFSAAASGNSAPVEAKSLDVDVPAHTRLVGQKTGGGDRPDLQTAGKVVSGGRALGSSDNFEIIFKLADTMGAGCGASRAAVDAGYVPNDMQVGQTGKIIAPDLYIAIGISGAIQHLAGIKDAGTIVAINNDENAPIFEVADLGLVGDLFQIVPELTAALG